MRILVTGSRSWQDRQAVWDALDEVVAAHPGEPVTVVHGGAQGADTIAEHWVNCAGTRHPGVRVRQECHVPNWGLNGRGAGPLRNQRMVDLGADLCLAWIRNGSRGASHCAAAAERAGIPTTRYEVP